MADSKKWHDLVSMSMEQLLQEEEKLLLRLKCIRGRQIEIEIEMRKKTEGVIAKLVGTSTGIYDGAYIVSVGNDGNVTVVTMTDEQQRAM